MRMKAFDRTNKYHKKDKFEGQKKTKALGEHAGESVLHLLLRNNESDRTISTNVGTNDNENGFTLRTMKRRKK